jgi:post-segregation antitoxin (ccd killing protein)
MGQPAAKLSVSIPHDLATAVRKRVGARGLSGFVARAISHELEREQLGSFLAELEEARGPVAKAELTNARRAWPKR